jgi:hypothetical protein
MHLTIPYQTLEINRIHLNNFKKDNKGRSIAPLSYKDSSVEINDLSILTPPLTVLDYDSTTSRLRFDLKDQKQFEVKLATLQQYLISTFYHHRLSLIGEDYNLHDIESMFQYLLEKSIFSAFIYSTTNIYKADGSFIKINTIKPGDRVRFALSIQGIILIDNYGKKGFRLRIQHYVPSLWLIE